ncbi:hypothetical protein [Undibacterium flavidum]|uniref:Immunity protein 50 of polymorphic toxin system n=1 Tax=Undibacterium flavidum TaxID=2762297 RepID=A0ABR6YAG5_9BURK|nr:hypothetical protein [Undibacterium flavidum]MBC3873625.1 hypothetical protein [Undibacterium flavidum]
MKHLPLVQSLVAEVVSLVWFSDYSICYLELGTLGSGLKLPNGRIGSPSGEITIFLGYDWNAESGGLQRSRIDFHSNEIEWESLVSKLQGAVIRNIELIATSAELEISLSTGVVLRTISDNGDDSDWSIKINKQVQGYLCIKNQKLKLEC